MIYKRCLAGNQGQLWSAAGADATPSGPSFGATETQIARINTEEEMLLTGW